MTLRRLILFLLLAAAAGALRAEEPARFFIERIDVRNAHRVSREVVVAESRLRENSTYGEQELREASLRVNRAPYLISADFSLEKGSERGKYILVITLNETRPFFYLFDGVFYLARDRNARVEYPSLLSSENDLALGFRFFVGARGALHFGLEGVADNRSYTADYASLSVGYTRYDIFGTRAFATLNLKKPMGATNAARVAPQVVLGVPLTLNQTLTLDYDPTDLGGSGSRPRLSQHLLTARWSYNTTNHPILPTQGTILTATPVVVWSDAAGFDYTTFPSRVPYVTHDRTLGVEATAAHYWELSDRDSTYASVGGGLARTRERGVRPRLNRFGLRTVDSDYGTFDAGIAHSFWSQERVAKDGEWRMQLDVHYGRHVDDRSANFIYQRPDSRETAISFVRRNAWGTIRFGAGYAW